VYACQSGYELTFPFQLLTASLVEIPALTIAKIARMVKMAMIEKE